ncbi:MAG: FkbM family methyltransferase [Kiritimatiellae bacterium]|nr:FkbM family methyltransferase [Kiritimatiellia bacterium]
MTSSTEFVFDEAFRRDLRQNAHHDGEVTFLESVLRPGMVVMEGGANRGVTAAAMAKAVGDSGHVHAFEPVPEYFATFKTNLARNRLANVTAYNLALSDRTGEMAFYRHGEGSGVAPVKEAEQIRVKTITIPDFLQTYRVPSLDFINLDCEGSELLIFRKARAVLREQCPPIFCEVHRQYLGALDQSVQDVVDVLTKIGYGVQPVQVKDLNTPSDFEQCSHIYASPPGRVTHPPRAKGPRV